MNTTESWRDYLATYHDDRPITERLLGLNISSPYEWLVEPTASLGRLHVVSATRRSTMIGQLLPARASRWPRRRHPRHGFSAMRSA